MEQQIKYSCFKIRLGLFLLLTFTSQLLLAQEDSTRFARDSVWIKPESSKYSPFEVSFEKPTISPALQSKYSDSLPSFSLKKSVDLPYQTNPSPLFQGDYLTSGIIKQFPHGILSGSGGQTSVPGIGRFNNASLLYQQALNQKLMFQLGMDAMKIYSKRNGLRICQSKFESQK